MSDQEPLGNLTVNVNQYHIRNAVRDVVEKLLNPEGAKQSFVSHVEKQQERITEHVDSLISKVNLTNEQVNSAIKRKLENDLESKIRQQVRSIVEEIIKEEVSICIRHIVQTGITIDIGTGWNRTAKIKTEEVNKCQMDTQ